MEKQAGVRRCQLALQPPQGVPCKCSHSRTDTPVLKEDAGNEPRHQAAPHRLLSGGTGTGLLPREAGFCRWLPIYPQLGLLSTPHPLF